LLILLVTRAIGFWVESWVFDNNVFGANGRTAGIIITAAVCLVVLVLVGRLFLRAGFERFLVAVEEEGWFSATSYKRNQGQRVRRGTILGILVIAFAGVFSLIQSNRLKAGAQDWSLNVPFSGRVNIEKLNDASALLQDRPRAASYGLD